MKATIRRLSSVLMYKAPVDEDNAKPSADDSDSSSGAGSSTNGDEEQQVSADDSDSSSGADSSTNGDAVADREKSSAEKWKQLDIELASINTSGHRRGSLYSKNVAVPLRAIAAFNEAEMIIEKTKKEEILLRAEPQLAKDTRECLEHISSIVFLLNHIFTAGKWLPADRNIESCLDLLNSEVRLNEEQKASLDGFKINDFLIDASELHNIPEASRSFFTTLMEWQQHFSNIDILFPEIFRFSSALHEESLNPYPISLQPVFKLYYLYQTLQTFEELVIKNQFHLWMRSKTKEKESEFEDLFDTDPFPEEAEFAELFTEILSPAEEAELENFLAATRKFLFVVLFAIKMLDQFKAMIDDARKYQKNIYEGSNDTNKVYRKEESNKKIQELNAELNSFFNEYARNNATELAERSLIIQACLPGISPPMLKLWVENNADLITTKEDRQYLAKQLSPSVLNLTMTLTIENGLVKARLKSNDGSMLQDLFISLNESTNSSSASEQASVAQDLMEAQLEAFKKTLSNKKDKASRSFPSSSENSSCVTDLLEGISKSKLENSESFAVLGIYILLYIQYTESDSLLMSLLAKIVEERYGYNLPVDKFIYEKIKVESTDHVAEEEPSRLSFLSSKKNKDTVNISTVVEDIFSDELENELQKKEQYSYSDIVLSTLDCESLIQKLTSLDYTKKIALLLTTTFDEITSVQRNRIIRTRNLLMKLPQVYRLRLIKNKYIKTLNILGLLLAYKEILCVNKPTNTGSALFIMGIVEKYPTNTPAFEFVLFYAIFLRLKSNITSSRGIWKEEHFPRSLLVDVFGYIKGFTVDIELGNESKIFSDWVESFLKNKVIANPSKDFVKMLGWFDNKELQRIFLGAPMVVLALPELRLKNQDVMSQFDDDLSSLIQIESIVELFILLARQEAALKFYKPMQETNNNGILISACRDSWVLQFRFLSIILDERLKDFTLSSSNEVMKNGICKLSSNMIVNIRTIPKRMQDCFSGSHAGIVERVTQDYYSLLRGVIFGFARFFAIMFHHLFSKEKDSMSSDACFFSQMYQHFQNIVKMMHVDLSREEPAIIFAMMAYFFNTAELLRDTNISIREEYGFFESETLEIDHLKKREDLNASYSVLEGKIQLACDYEDHRQARISSDDGVAPLCDSMFFRNSAERIACELALPNIKYVLPS